MTENDVAKLKEQIEELEQQLAEEREEFEWDLKAARESSASTVKRLEEENITWRSFWNGPDGTRGPISARWNVTGWPTIYVLDRQGVIRYMNTREKQLDEAVEHLLQESKLAMSQDLVAAGG